MLIWFRSPRQLENFGDLSSLGFIFLAVLGQYVVQEVQTVQETF